VDILLTTTIIGSIGLVCAALLAVVAWAFGTGEDDPRLAVICDTLPQTNCGGCGFAGCLAYAKAILEDGANPALCIPGGNAVVVKLSEILGIATAPGAESKVAVVMCGGNLSDSHRRYVYNGITDRIAAHAIHGGDKSCTYGCLGYGTCARVCTVNGVEINDGLARIVKERCVGCGACIKVCPRHLVKLVPATHTLHVLCSSKDKGSVVRSLCKRGCIGCKICEKFDSVFKVDGHLAVVDYSKPPALNEDVIAKCPGKCIGRGV